tara:strand:+ start:139 stop:270 length:132 start_codon:yes stop_codon:yes gene_type:complete
MPKPLTMAGIFRLLEKVGHRPQQGLNAKVKYPETVNYTVKGVD